MIRGHHRQLSDDIVSIEASFLATHLKINVDRAHGSVTHLKVPEDRASKHRFYRSCSWKRQAVLETSQLYPRSGSRAAKSCECCRGRHERSTASPFHQPRSRLRPRGHCNVGISVTFGRAEP